MDSRLEVIQEIDRHRAYDNGSNGHSGQSMSAVIGTGITQHPLANEEVLRLVNQALLPQRENQRGVVTFAGMDHGNGCSRICVSVAELLSRDAERSVCLVEANLRSPAVYGPLGATTGPGLTDALTSKEPIRSFCVRTDLRSNLWSLSCGTLFPDAPNLLTSGALRERVAELRAEFDYVIIDTPPLTKYADAIALGQLGDGLVLVVESGKTRRDETAEAVASLRACKVNILAAVLNKDTPAIPERIYKHL